MNIILWDLPRDEYNYANQLQYQINNLGCVIYNTWGLLMSTDVNGEE